MPQGVFSNPVERSRKISEKMRGKNNPMFGKIPKMAFKKGQIPWNKGLTGVQSGDKSPRWKGGNSKNYKTGYYSSEYKKWRLAVFYRDDFTCKKCGVRHQYITAHHIRSFAKFPELRFEINNGVTLCEDCHKKTDNYKGKTKKHHSNYEME